MNYTELQVTTNFSFLRGGSHPEELVEQALALGYTELAITDRNTLAGIVRAYTAAKGKNIRIIPACRLDLLDGPSLLAYPTNKEAYARLSALLTEGNLRAEKGECHLYKADVYRHAQGIKFILVPPDQLNKAFEIEADYTRAAREYAAELGEQLLLGAKRSYQANDAKMLARLAQLAQALGIDLVALNDVHYHVAERRELQDVLTCIREKCSIYTAGFRLHQNAERYLKPQEEMIRLFAQYPQAIQNTQKIVAAAQFCLSELKYIYPEEITSQGRSPQEELVYLTWKGAREKFGGVIPPKIQAMIEYELEFIERKNYAAYFLTVHDFVAFARSQDILCQGRGSAANSTVCYCLGITSVDPSKFNLLFSRFMSDARDEPPDIDVDFEHERREEVMQYIYRKFGRDRAAIVATVTQQHYKGSVRDVAKAMGLSMDAVNSLASSGWEFTEEWYQGKTISSGGFSAADPHLRKVLQLTDQYMGFPRQLGQHTGGFVITQGKLSDLCPILNARMQDRTCIEWNKDDIESLGFLKVDVLALGMLTCIRKAFDLAKHHYGLDLNLANIPQDDPKVYEMICRADTIGVFQIESRAQMSMLPRLRPTQFYDLVIEVAIVRPGPIQGDMVHPYLRRRNGLEKVEYPSEEIKGILERTLGVPLFQEQAMEIAIVAAGFTPAEADQLRRSMATFKAKGQVSAFHEKMIKGMKAKGYTEEFAERVFKQLEGFGSYGFPESHAVSFALLVYISSWLKCYYPDIFAAAILNSQPMGFYQPAQLVADARKHGVTVLPVDVCFSFWDNSLEEKVPSTDRSSAAKEYCALRIGFRQVKGLKEEELQVLIAARDRYLAFSNTQVEFRSATESNSQVEFRSGVEKYRDPKHTSSNTQDGFHSATESNSQVEFRSETEKYRDPNHTSSNTQDGFHSTTESNGQVEFRSGAEKYRDPKHQNPIKNRTQQKPAFTIAQLYDAGVSLSTLERLADADAFRSLGLDRRKALWEVAALSDHAQGLFAGLPADNSSETNIQLPAMSLSQHVLEDYRSLSLSLKAHPLSFVRQNLLKIGVQANANLQHCKDGDLVRVAGLVLVRQRPGTASGICFITIEDESGSANLVVFAKLFQHYRKEIVRARLLMVEGKVQKEGEVIHVVVKRCYDLSGLLAPLNNPEANGSEDQSIDYRPSTYPGSHRPKEEELVKSNKGPSFDYAVFYGGRNFH